MPKKTNRVTSRYADAAGQLLASRIKSVRLEKRIPAREIAIRAGISRDLLYRIEQGDPRCSIGTVFEVASLLGVTLFQPDLPQLQSTIHNAEHTLTLLPRRAVSTLKVDDDF